VAGRDRRDDVLTVEGGWTVASDALCYLAVLRAGGRGEAEPKWGGGMGRREHDDNSHLGEGIVSVARPMVGAVGKQTGRGVLPVGCFGVRKEGGREPRRGGVGRLPFEERRDEAGERWG
jgi:hypothetical protein